jgi:DNA-binding CsgD family transcriptional regulator
MQQMMNNAMKLQITEKGHWYKNHPEEGYVKKVCVINGNIVHCRYESEHDVTLNVVDDELLDEVLGESGLETRVFHVVLNLEHVCEITRNYKQAIANLLYNWKPPLRTIGLYNVCGPMRITLESLAAVVPQNLQFIFADSYEELIEKILSGRNDLHIPNNTSEDEQMKLRFLESVAKFTWLNMLDEPISLPPLNNRYYPYFKAIDEIRNDLLSKEAEKKKESLLLKKEFESRIAHMNIKMNAQAEMSKKTTQSQEKEIRELRAIIGANESELSRISRSCNEKITVLRKLFEYIQNIDIDARQKKKMQNLCQSLLDTEAIENNLQNDLSLPESTFLNDLQNRHPALNQRELKISLLVRQNYDTDEISRSLGITKRGMESIRYRLHKKLGLGKHQSIKAYLSRYTLAS